MPSIFVLKEKITSPMEWYSRMMKKTGEWEFDNLLETYHLGSVYLFESSDSVSFDDMSEDEFFGWEVSSWIALADGKELIYGYYNEDSGNAEFVHIKNGKCIREYRVYGSETETDEGVAPAFTCWMDVAEYVDENLL